MKVTLTPKGVFVVKRALALMKEGLTRREAFEAAEAEANERERERERRALGDA